MLRSRDSMQLLQPRRTRVRARGAGNGGFPEPPDGEAVRVVHRSHQACGSRTRIKLPSALPEWTVHRVLCDGCHESFEPEPEQAGSVRGGPPLDEAVREYLAELPLPDLSGVPRERIWAWASVPLAVLGVIAGLALLQGSDSTPTPSAAASRSATADNAKFIEQPGYSLALPAGWKRTQPPNGAVFAAESRDGMADATLWIERAPGLSFERFERRSLEQLSELGGNARVVDRVEGPTVETSIAELRADAPVADGVTAPYRVTLRAAGPFRHYLVTVTQPGAGSGVLGDVELIHGSLRPEVQPGAANKGGS
jgi:hypothetical protein